MRVFRKLIFPPVNQDSTLTSPLMTQLGGITATFALPLASDFKYKFPPAAKVLVPAMVNTPLLATENFPEAIVLVPEFEKVTFLK